VRRFHFCKTPIIANRRASFVCVCKEFFCPSRPRSTLCAAKQSGHCSTKRNAVSRASGFFLIVNSYSISTGHSGSRAHEPLIGRNDIMKKIISVYWPLAIVVPLAAAACLHICGDAASRSAQAPLAADQLTAELARAVSYGMVDSRATLPAKPMRAAPAMPLAEAS
jgi:hypothetical protein